MISSISGIVIVAGVLSLLVLYILLRLVIIIIKLILQLAWTTSNTYCYYHDNYYY